MSAGNCAVYRYSLDNVVIPNIPAGATVEVQVVLNGARVGDAGIASTKLAPMTSGISISPVRISASNVGQIPLTNGSAADINPVDTLDFVIHLIRATGQSIAPPG